MTISKDTEIRIPVPLLSVVLSLIFSAFMIWGGLSINRADLERAKKDIEILRQEKVNRDAFNMVIDKLNIIDRKLDSHISNVKP